MDTHFALFVNKFVKWINFVHARKALMLFLYNDLLKRISFYVSVRDIA